MAGDRKFTISGPGASDILTSPGGEDLPGTSNSKGMSQTRGESIVTDARNLEPALASEQAALPPERSAAVPANAAPDRRTGSQTGTIGGGGADAHNPAPVRATGADDPAVPQSKKPPRRRTTKKY
jgi:hypothetical protein